MIYKNSNVFYVDLSKFSSYNGTVYTEKLSEFLKENNLTGKNVCLDFSLIEGKQAQSLMELTDIWAKQTKRIKNKKYLRSWAWYL